MERGWHSLSNFGWLFSLLPKAKQKALSFCCRLGFSKGRGSGKIKEEEEEEGEEGSFQSSCTDSVYGFTLV